MTIDRRETYFRRRNKLIGKNLIERMRLALRICHGFSLQMYLKNRWADIDRLKQQGKPQS